MISAGSQQVNRLKKIAPIIIRKAIEDLYKTQFRLLGNFAKKKLSQAKRKILRLVKRNQNVATDEIYHGCATRHLDGMRLLINFKKGEKCLIPTANPYWTDPNNVLQKQVQTRN